MIRSSRPTAWLTMLLVFAFVIETVLCGISPIPPARAVTVEQLLKTSESTPGGLTITWYSAKRLKNTPKYTDNGCGRLAGLVNFCGFSTFYRDDSSSTDEQIDYDKSDEAFKSFDHSVCLGTESFSASSIDTSKWVPADNSAPSSDVRDSFVWGEVKGYVKMPVTGPLGVDPTDYINNGKSPFKKDFIMEIRGLKVGNWEEQADVKTYCYIGNCAYSKDEIIPFTLRLGNRHVNPGEQNKQFNLSLFTSEGESGKFNYVPMECFYSRLSLKDMQPFFKFNPKDYTLTLDQFHSSFPVGDYEYGIVTGGAVTTATGFQPLQLGVNHLTPDSGDIVIRNKVSKDKYITVGSASLPAPKNLAVIWRTPSTAALFWLPPPQEVSQGNVISYDIYRRPVEGNNQLSFNNPLSVGEPSKVVTTTGFPSILNTTAGLMRGRTFTDQGLAYDSTYEYFVKANYPTGCSSPSETARTDSVAMEGLASTPGGLKIQLINQTPKADLLLSWSASRFPDGIKEYIIYRRLIQDGGLTQIYPSELARTSYLSYLDRGLNLTDTCEYYVQAIAKNGSPSYISPVLVASPQKLVPPGGLRAGGVLRQGDIVQYDFPGDSTTHNVLMGPEREIALRWEPSSDNSGIAGYNIYRFAAKGYGITKRGLSILLESNGSINQPDLIGATSDTLFVDRGVEFGKYYTYYVEARYADGITTAMSQVSVTTEKSSLSGLAITDGSKNLAPEPAFAYYQTQYALNVANAVKSITLAPKKADPLAKVTVNGVEVKDDSSIGPLALDPGDNTFYIDVVPVDELLIKPETVRYTLTVKRANLDNPPALTLPESGAVINEGDTYKAAGKLGIPSSQSWTGTADYGDRSGEKPLALNADGSFSLEHKYLDNGQYQISVNFRYQDLGLVKGSVDLTVQNVAPSLNGVKDEYPTKEGSLLTIEGSITDPGQDSWTVAGECGWGPIEGKVNGDKFTLQYNFYDQQREYDMVLKVKDDDGGESSRNVKIKEENVAPTVQAAGQAAMVQRGFPFTGTGSFTDPGREEWLAAVDFGDGGGEQDLAFNKDKTFALSHTYLTAGDFTVTVRVKENKEGGEAGSASFKVKVKDYLFALEAGADASLNEGDKLVRDIPVRDMPDKVKSITVDYGDGSGEKPVILSIKNPAAPLITDRVQYVLATSAGTTRVLVIPQTGIIQKAGVLPQIGVIPLQHVYTDNGDYTVKIKLTDVDGDICEGGFNVKAANVPPTVKLEPIGGIYPGNSLTGCGSFTDPGADTWTVKIDFKDGSEPCEVSINPDKTFSFSHSYYAPGIYNIEAVVSDDDGGIGRGSQPAMVQLLVIITGGGSDSHDASLHSFTGLANLAQDDGVHTDDGFIPDCLTYKSTGAYMGTMITAVAGPGATLTYTIDAGAALPLPQNTGTLINLDVGHTLTITVTAQDGTTIREYTIEHI